MFVTLGLVWLAAQTDREPEMLYVGTVFIDLIFVDALWVLAKGA